MGKAPNYINHMRLGPGKHLHVGQSASCASRVMTCDPGLDFARWLARRKFYLYARIGLFFPKSRFSVDSIETMYRSGAQPGNWTGKEMHSIVCALRLKFSYAARSER